MQKAKRNIRLKVLAGLMALWLMFFGVFAVWEVRLTRTELLDEVYQSMGQVNENINEYYLEYWDARVPQGLALEIQPIDDIKALITRQLVLSKQLGEVEMACYDEYLELFASSGTYMVISYEVPATSTHRQFGQSHYGIIDIENVLPEDAAEKLIEYASYHPEECSYELGALNGYSIFFVGLWSDGLKLVPKKIVVTEERITESTMEYYRNPQFDENGEMTEAGNMEIVWTYENEPDETLIEGMVFCSDAAWNYGFGSYQVDKDLMETATDAWKATVARDSALHDDPGHIENSIGYGQMTADGGWICTEYYGYWYDYTLYKADRASASDVYNSNTHYPGPTLVAVGRVYPLKECAGTLVIVGLGSLLMFLMAAIILIWQITKVYEKQAELEAQRRRTTNAVAHDLKTPMAAIVGYAENLLENTRPDKQEKYLRAIYNQVGRMDETVGKMLELSRLEAEADKLNLTAFFLADLCREVMEDYLGDEVRFLLQGDAAIEADRAMMRRVLENFISNARKHTAPGGVIEITVEQGKCTVFNPGDPIPEEILPKLWEAYYQADLARSQRGSGLGLSIIREILSRHGFAWGAENRDSGVAFWFAY